MICFVRMLGIRFHQHFSTQRVPVKLRISRWLSLVKATGPRSVGQRKASGSRNDELWQVVVAGPRGGERGVWTGGRWGVTRGGWWGEPGEAAEGVPEGEVWSGAAVRSSNTSERDRFPGKITMTLVKRSCIELPPIEFNWIISASSLLEVKSNRSKLCAKS